MSDTLWAKIIKTIVISIFGLLLAVIGFFGNKFYERICIEENLNLQEHRIFHTEIITLQQQFLCIQTLLIENKEILKDNKNDMNKRLERIEKKIDSNRIQLGKK